MHILRFMPQLQEVDISGNLLERLMISDFSDATSLRILNVSHNRIRTIECDSTTPMTALEMLDLSANNLTTLPGSELRNMEGLRTLILKSNPITVAGEGHLTLDNLQILDLSNLSALGVVEAGTFSRLPHLHTVFLHDNTQLVYLSPRAFENISIFSLDISRTGLRSLEPTLLDNVAQIRLSGVPFDCRCLSEQLYSITTTTITDWVNATCITKTGTTIALSSLSSTLFAKSDTCRPNAIVPFGGKVEATVGQTFKIYCAGSEIDDIVKWKTPSGIVEIGINPEFSTGFERLDYFTSTLFEPEQHPTTRKRAEATSEYYRLDVVLAQDGGDYECTVQREKYSISRKINLVVNKPRIELKVTHVYNICLKWTITDNNTEIYSTCLSERTLKVRSLMEDLGVEGAVFICLLVTCLFLFFCGRCIYNRLHIYARAKRQSKLIQSISGQSILSHTGSQDATTYENHQLQISSSISFCNRADASSGPLLSDVV
uniref:Ig-like domain-containing protein n=1 Tax=Heterorhabditis bacteriophora TaxID=37862 RepID=A0A1I7XMZ9_HETBA